MAKRPRQDRILIVDDDAVNRDILAEVFSETYGLDFAENGTRALQLAERVLPDLVLLDIMMPDIDGYEVCRRMRRNPTLRHAKILLVSAKALLSERLMGYEAGADDYIAKPFDVNELEAKVRVFLRLKRVEEVDELRANMLDVLSHETRTPMTSILAGSELLLDDPDVTEPQRQWIEMVLTSARRLHGLLEKGTLLCAYRSGTVVIEMADLELGALVRSVIDARQEVLHHKGLRLDCELGRSLWISGHEEHLKLVLSALVENAIMHSPPSGVIGIAVKEHMGQASVVVTDHGSGMSPELAARAFDGFVVEDIKHHERGVGLSLALSRAVIQFHGGDITVDSQPHTATSFFVSIPRLNPPTIKPLAGGIRQNPVAVERV